MDERFREEVFRVPEGWLPMRVDSFVADRFDDLSRSSIKSLDAKFYVNGIPVKNSFRVKAGDEVLFVRKEEEAFPDVIGEDIPLDVLYEDDDVLVINKAQGMVVHPAAGNRSGTLVNALVYRYGSEFSSSFSSSDEDDEEGNTGRPGIVHRLDKDTSGVMIIAKNRKAMASLAPQFAEHTVKKVYVAIVKGEVIPPSGAVTGYIGRSSRDRKKFEMCPASRGKWSESYYRVLENYPGFSLVSVEIKTGRTHQIRVHMQSIKHPVLGDPIYSRRDSVFPDASLMLHSKSLEITLPSGERKVFDSPLPSRFEAVLTALRERGGKK